jgi:cell division protein FtsI/penicillin-binding protein 2
MTLGTTLDLSLQRAAAAACEQGVGAVVALDPRDGRVLAYLERTAADPSPFVDAEVDLTSPSTSPSVDGASGAVQTWEVTERDAIFAALSVANGGPRIPRDELEQRARALGFGHGTGVDLRDEAEGSLREVHHRDDGDSEEGRFTIAIRATPLQVAVAFAAIVNGGVLYQPRLVDRVLSPDGAIALRRDAPVVRSRAVLTAGARDRVLATMRQATRDIVGWSLGADGYVALAPAVDPRLVVVARYASGSLARGDLRDASEPAALAVARAWLSRTHATGDSQP